MSPKQYRSSEFANKAKMRSTRFDPSLDAALEAAATDAGVSVNALVNTFVAEGLASYYASNNSSDSLLRATSGGSEAFAGGATLTSSVQNYPETLAYVRDTHQSTIEALSGKPEEEAT